MGEVLEVKTSVQQSLFGDSDFSIFRHHLFEKFSVSVKRLVNAFDPDGICFAMTVVPCVAASIITKFFVGSAHKGLVTEGTLFNCKEIHVLIIDD